MIETLEDFKPAVAEDRKPERAALVPARAGANPHVLPERSSFLGRKIAQVGAACAVSAAGVLSLLWRKAAPSPVTSAQPAPAPTPQPAPQSRPDLLGDPSSHLRPDQWPATEPAPAPAQDPALAQPQTPPQPQPVHPILQSAPKLELAAGTSPATSPSNIISLRNAAVLGTALTLAAIPAVLIHGGSQGGPASNPFTATAPQNPSGFIPHQEASNLPTLGRGVGSASAPGATTAGSPGSIGGGKPVSGTGILQSLRDASGPGGSRSSSGTGSVRQPPASAGLQRPIDATTPGAAHDSSVPEPIAFCQHRPAAGQSALPGLPICDDIVAPPGTPAPLRDSPAPGLTDPGAGASADDSGVAGSAAGGGDAGCGGGGSGGDGGDGGDGG